MTYSVYHPTSQNFDLYNISRLNREVKQNSAIVINPDYSCSSDKTNEVFNFSFSNGPPSLQVLQNLEKDVAAYIVNESNKSYKKIQGYKEKIKLTIEILNQLNKLSDTEQCDIIKLPNGMIVNVSIDYSEKKVGTLKLQLQKELSTYYHCLETEKEYLSYCQDELKRDVAPIIEHVIKQEESNHLSRDHKPLYIIKDRIMKLLSTK